MERTITVRGVGKLSVKPDLISVSLTITKKSKDYGEAMTESAKLQSALRDALESIGFKRDALKTSSFNVNTEYESVRDQNGTFRQVFAGYACQHQMSLQFGFDTDLLSSVLESISRCIAEPELYISFTVKDKDQLVDTLLRNATENAFSRAKTLASAARVELGELISIDYSWKDINFVSNTRFANNAKMMMRGAPEASMDMGIEPESIDLSENATFVWEII